MLTVLIIFVVILFFLEVIFGSSREVYNAEIGYPADFQKGRKISIKEFFLRLLPFAALCTVGLYLLLKVYSILIDTF